MAGQPKEFDTILEQCGRLPLSAQGLIPAASALAVVLLSAGTAQAQTSIDPGNAADVGASALAGELTASKVIQDPGAPYENLFQNFDVGLTAAPKVGAARGRLGVVSLNLSDAVGTPVDRGARPENSELKIGNFYLDILSATASLLYTDNENLSEVNRQDELVSALSLNLRASYQLNDGLNFGVQGSLIWLPLEGRAGVNGFGIVDPFAAFSLDDGQLFNAQVEVPFTLGKWDFLVYDYFDISNRSLYGLGDAGQIDFYDGETFSDGNTIRNRKLLSNYPGTGGAYRDRTQSTGNFQADALDYHNAVGVVAQRILPTETQATAGYQHDNYWYSSSARAIRGGVRAYNYRDQFYAHLQSIRENLRFKPYAYYTTHKTDIETGWNQSVGGGVLGPITDQLQFQGEVGYTFSGSGKRDTETWGAALLHDAGPFTKHAVRYRRHLTDPEDLVEQTFSYDIEQILGPYMTGRAFYRHSIFEDLLTPVNDAEQDLVGASIGYRLDQFGNVELVGLYRKFSSDNPGVDDYTTWTLQFIYNFPIGETVNGTFFYQFEDRDSETPGNSYYENLFGLRVTKTF